jgi:proteasome accessory factor C
MYAELDGDVVRVDAWPDGEVFRKPARLSPMEAKALLLALDLVGPLVAATAQSDLDSVRAKLTNGFGGYGAPTVPATAPTESEQHVLTQLTTAMREHRVLRIEYYSQGRGELAVRDTEPMRLQRLKQHWYAVAWCRRANDLRSFRLDRIKSINVLDESFEPRDVDLAGYTADTPRTLTDSPRIVTMHMAASAAGHVLEALPDARRLVDGSAVYDIATAGDTWLVEEVLKYRGQATVLAPEALREKIAVRAHELRDELCRVPVTA